MDKHKCKLCSRTFNNGRALGGHMKSHLTASAPSTRNKKKLTESHTDSASSSSSSFCSSKNLDEEQKLPVYVLRENPKRSRRIADPEFTFANLDHSVSSAVAVMGNEASETESECPSRRRSKRVKRPGLEIGNESLKKSPSLDESTATESPVSSVSDASPEEDLAMCLVMLSRGGAWKTRADEAKKCTNGNLKKPKKEFKCENCSKSFGSYRTLGRHKKICSSINPDESIFKCPFCDKMFRSGQALGGHKRSHLVSAAAASTAVAATPTKPKNFFIDLNLPAPLEDESSSVVS